MSELEPTRTCSNPTATEILRRMLDERGVEHYDGTECTLWLKDGVGYRASADEGLNGFMQIHLWCTTPEQAIAATLGATDARPTQAESSGTCEYCNGKSFDGQTVMISNHGWQRINFCPNCGRRIEQ